MNQTEITGRWIPPGCAMLEEQHDAIVYGNIPDAAGRCAAIGYHGKARHRDFWYTFRTADQRAKYIAGYFDGRKGHADLMAKRKTDRAGAHTLKVGDLLKCSWGYDQTNIDYYQVTRVIGAHTVEIREIGSRTVSADGNWTGNCSPTPNDFKGEPMVKRVSKDNTVRMTSYSWAYPCALNDVGHWTAYA